jgi:hypothetical protein
MKALLMLLAHILVAGCSNKAVYDNLQHNQRLRCEQLPLSEYERCMRNTDKSFEEYERERKEYLEEREKTTKYQS